MARRRHRDAPRGRPDSAGPALSPPASAREDLADRTPTATPGGARNRTLFDIPPARVAAREDIAPLLAAHLAPVAAMLFLGQSGREILLLLAVDTALTICVLTWLVIEHITEADSKTSGVTRALTHAGAALVVGAFFSLVLVVPIAFVALGDAADFDVLLASRGFLAALGMQVVGSAWSLVGMHRDLSARDDDETYLSTRFKFVIARWVVVLGLAFSGFATLLGPTVGAGLLVLAYCGAGIWFGLDPARAHRLFHPDKSSGSAPGR